MRRRAYIIAVKIIPDTVIWNEVLDVRYGDLAPGNKGGTGAEPEAPVPTCSWTGELGPATGCFGSVGTGIGIEPGSDGTGGAGNASLAPGTSGVAGTPEAGRVGVGVGIAVIDPSVAMLASGGAAAREVADAGG